MQKKQTTKQDTDLNAEDGESFLSRWSRRKSDTDLGSESSQTASAMGPEQNIGLGDQPDLIQHYLEQPDNTDIQVAATDDPIISADSQIDQPLTDTDMPDISSLNENSDYSLFMSEGVSEKLRKLALRKLFSGAGFNIKDGLDDYDDDFTSFEGLGDLITCDMKHQQEMKEKRELEEQQAKDLNEREKARDTDDTADNTETEAIDDPDREAGEENLSAQKPTDEKTDNSSTPEHNTTEVDSDKTELKKLNLKP